jgi:hypothetical protein
MLLLSKDGAFLLTYPRRVSELVMSNAARADVLVRCYSPGTSHVFSEGAAGGYAFSGPLFTMDVKSNGGEAPLVFVIEGYQQKDFFLPCYLILFYLMISHKSVPYSTGTDRPAGAPYSTGTGRVL